MRVIPACLPHPLHSCLNPALLQVLLLDSRLPNLQELHLNGNGIECLEPVAPQQLQQKQQGQDMVAAVACPGPESAGVREVAGFASLQVSRAFPPIQGFAWGFA